MKFFKYIFASIFSVLFWRTHHIKGVNCYQINTLTGKKRVVTGASGYSPVDRSW